MMSIKVEGESATGTVMDMETIGGGMRDGERGGREIGGGKGMRIEIEEDGQAKRLQRAAVMVDGLEIVGGEG